MLRSRIIPCLLVRNKGLVKTVQFKDSKYVGDPINAVKIFNEKEVDELMVLDIDATKENRKPDFKMIQNLANESRMPLCYGGGVKTVEDAKQIIHLGAEKVALSSSIINNPDLIADIAAAVGVQSVIAVLDVKKKGLFGKYQVYTHNGTKATGKDPKELAMKFEKLGVGEIVINSIDNDGMMKGYDHKLIDVVRSCINIPMTVLGGAGSLNHIREMIKKHKVIGVAAGSIFVFKGKYKAVLINYPNRKEIKELLN
ncbi:AglZ/HisF2 family acetamidino modification protein [Aquimarina brevivitae]|uniref:imidazole glycerol-phosphate synthase n=1 Tax=Aquimarina brevivitae TaxID=323412 RepID=A0A4Q7PK29_9FLAO|nr:AglZ/HisF2 family acetamidino modification protein [Aquimarina brevivitae]RZS99292.1 cyclase [Aquimarina brevivitae]